MPKISFGWFGCAVDQGCHGRPLKADCSKRKKVFTSLISKDLETIGPSNPWAVQSAKNLSLLDKILYFSLLFSTLLKHLHSWAEVAFHLLWCMTSECFPCSLFSSVHSPCMVHISPSWQVGNGERKPDRQPKASCRKLGSYKSVLRDLVLSEGGLFGEFLSSAQVTRALFCTELLTQIPTGIPTGLVPITH